MSNAMIPVLFSRRRPSRPGGDSSAIDKVSVRGSAVGMHVGRSFKFSMHHVYIIKREYFSFRVVPGEIAKAGRIVVFVPAARPTRCLARFGSPVPTHRLVVPGLLILALTKRGADENEQSAAKQNQSSPQ